MSPGVDAKIKDQARTTELEDRINDTEKGLVQCGLRWSRNLLFRPGSVISRLF